MNEKTHIIKQEYGQAWELTGKLETERSIHFIIRRSENQLNTSQQELLFIFFFFLWFNFRLFSYLFYLATIMGRPVLEAEV